MQCEHTSEESKGYLGWAENLSAILRKYPSPRMGCSFNNIETRSVWIYDGVRWVNTTQGNPFTMITEPSCAGVVHKGYPSSFYYTSSALGEVQFDFVLPQGSANTVKSVAVTIENESDLVFIEWNGDAFSTAVSRLHGDVVRRSDLEAEITEREENDELLSKMIEEVHNAHTKFVDETNVTLTNINSSINNIKNDLGGNIVRMFADGILQSGGKAFMPQTKAEKVYGVEGYSNLAEALTIIDAKATSTHAALPYYTYNYNAVRAAEDADINTIKNVMAIKEVYAGPNFPTDAEIEFAYTPDGEGDKWTVTYNGVSGIYIPYGSSFVLLPKALYGLDVWIYIDAPLNVEVPTFTAYVRDADSTSAGRSPHIILHTRLNALEDSKQ